MKRLGVAMAVLLLAGAGRAQERLSFTTEDGVRIQAHLYGKGERGVVLAHGGRFLKESWAKQARVLEGAGFRVLAFDFRGFGESKGPAEADLGAPLHLDVLAAVRYLRETGAQTVSVVGGSMGGSAGADAIIHGKPGLIDRLVVLGAGAGSGPPERLSGRKLFIVTRDDASGSGPRLPRIQAQYAMIPEPKEMVILEGSAHAQFLFETDQGERVMRDILRFLRDP
jgi:pimeloyl-ACP methyl ester carboxylesterase